MQLSVIFMQYRLFLTRHYQFYFCPVAPQFSYYRIASFAARISALLAMIAARDCDDASRLPLGRARARRRRISTIHTSRRASARHEGPTLASISC